MIIKDNEIKSIDSVGNKAWNLLLMKNEGFHVPDFWVLPISLSDKEIHQSLKKNIDESFYAVRSSSFVEDGKESSFAGQFLTCTRVLKKDIFKSINLVKEHAVNYTGSPIPIIIQKWIEPEYSGIAFSRDPKGDYLSPVIEYTKGSAEKNVSGKVNPYYFVATYRNLKKSNFFEKKVTKIVKDIENIFHYPVDIEWAYYQNILYILQVRPITSLGYDNLDLLNTINEVLENETDYILERADISQNFMYTSPFMLDLVGYIFGEKGPVQKAYKKIGIHYSAEPYFKKIGAYMYIDKQAELQQIMPSHAYGQRNLKKTKISSFSRIIITIKNIFSLSNFLSYKDFPEKLRESLAGHLSTEWHIHDFESLKRLIHEVYPDIVYAGLYSQISEKKTQKIISKNFHALDLNCSEKWNGNSLDILDDTKFTFQQKIDKNIPDTIQNFREYSRWISVKLGNTIRSYLLEIAHQHNFKNPSCIFHVYFDEILEKSFSEDILEQRQKQFNFLKKQKHPFIISDLNLVKNNSILILSKGSFSGIVSDTENLESNISSDIILYTEALTPDLVQFFPYISGIITKHGGTLSHLSIMAREHNIPVIQTDKTINIGDNVTWSDISTIFEINGV